MDLHFLKNIQMLSRHQKNYKVYSEMEDVRSVRHQNHIAVVMMVSSYYCTV